MRLLKREDIERMIDYDIKISGENFEKLVEDKIKAGSYTVLDDLFLTLKDPSLIIEDNGNEIINQGFNMNLYRGESQVFQSSKANIYRFNANCDDYEKRKQVVLDKIRLKEFEDTIKELDIIKNWRYSVLYDAIAQHYGMKTDLLDITSSFRVALFFACCEYDKVSKRYRALNHKDLNGKSHNEKYGVIYKKINLDIINNEYEEKSNKVWALGYQPLKRCQSQYGYVIRLKDDMDLSDTSTGFIKFKFKKTVELSEKIFDIMDAGKILFPNERVDSIDSIINRIRVTKGFREKNIEDVIYESNLSIDIKNKIKEEIYNEYDVDKNYVELTAEELDNINIELKSVNIEIEAGKKPTERKVYNDDEGIYIESYFNRR